MTSDLPSAVAFHHHAPGPVQQCLVNGQKTWMAALLHNHQLLCLSFEEPDHIRTFDLAEHTITTLAADADGLGFLAGTRQGDVFLLEPAENTQQKVLTVEGEISHIAASPTSERTAVAVHHDVVVFDDTWKECARFHACCGITGLAFNPKGLRLAVAEGHGLSLWWSKGEAAQKGQPIPWHGHPHALQWSPDGKMVLAATREGTVFGWRLADDKPMQMQGYSAPIISWGFSADQQLLITSGAAQAVCWPFFGGGPWGKNPLLLGPERDDALVSAVAPHPRDAMTAIGYDDGMIVFAPFDDTRMAIQVHPALAGEQDSVMGMGWSADGTSLLAALASGHMLGFTFDSVQAAVRARVDRPKAG
ncbi:MAG: WD40 repeat domain-containing protein [Alphaproteobacteria bacterium]|nr:WD40 repeat domain-containing protein [Alphaproteobacteria bacterium]NDG05031.1 WD40 repeat domain-containing protein [Alphaproteobacteria bacterium]